MYLIKNRPSQGGRALANGLGIRVRTSGTASRDLAINWGCSDIGGDFDPIFILNQPSRVATAINKVSALRTLDEANVSVPVFVTEDLEGTENDTDDIWLARTKIKASGGTGIVVVRKGEVFPKARLYTKYVRKELEYRIHVLFGTAALISQKKRRNDTEQTADQKLIRNFDNGWVFAINDITEPSTETINTALQAVEALSLDFGAVDLVVCRESGNAFVLEVNTAPGLEGTTLETYIRHFRLEDERFNA